MRFIAPEDLLDIAAIVVILWLAVFLAKDVWRGWCRDWRELKADLKGRAAMTLDDAAIRIARETRIPFREAKDSLTKLTESGCNVDQSVAMLRAFAKLTGSETAEHLVALVADVLADHGPERRKGVAVLTCGHEVTTAWCTDCAGHQKVKPT